MTFYSEYERIVYRSQYCAEDGVLEGKLKYSLSLFAYQKQAIYMISEIKNFKLHFTTDESLSHTNFR